MSRDTLAETRFGQERMLLYSIINAVTDPILLTDTEGKLIIANTPRREAVRGAGRRERGLAAGGRAEQHAVLGGAVDERRRRVRAGAARAAAGRSARRLRPAVRAAQLAGEGRAAGHLRRLGPAQRHRPGPRQGGDRGELSHAARGAGGGARRAAPARADHRLGGRPDPGDRPGRRHRADERAGRAAVQRAGHRRTRRRSAGSAPTART